MSTVPVRRKRRGRIILHAVSWKEYSRMLKAFEHRRSIRLTYDRGVLEIMSPLWEHENPSDILSLIVVILTEELQLARRAGGSTTLRLRRQQRGLEPDKCWWIANAYRLQGRASGLDLRTDPPPDLAVEVDVTSSSLDRMSIYATLGVREVWRVTEQALTIHVLDDTGRYQVQTHSHSFPIISATDLWGFITQIGQVDDTTLGLQFRAWLRQRLANATPQP